MANINGLTGTAADVDANNQVKVTTNTDPTKAGSVRIFSENDPGTITGTADCKSPETSHDYRLRVGVDTVLDNETFNYANQSTAKFSYLSSPTLTFDQTGGVLRSNGSGITTLSTAARFLSFQYFPLFGQETPLYVEFNAGMELVGNTTNTTIDFGLFIPNATAASLAPTDGIYFRYNATGWLGVINYNGTETTVALTAFSHAALRQYEFIIAINERDIEFWIDDVLYGSLTTPASQGQPCMASSLPMCIRHTIAAGAASNAQRLRVADYSVFLGDIATNKSWGDQMAGMGNTLQVQQGATTGGQLSTYAVGSAPSTLTLTASTAPATNTLGGLFALPVAVAVGESDYPLFAWQNPAGTTAIPGKTFYCTGVIVPAMWVSVAALTGGPIVFNFAIGFGSTAASLATTESTTFSSGTTKIARKYPIGAQSFAATAPLGTVGQGFQVTFPSPIPTQPSEFLHIIMRASGTALTAGTAQIRGGVTILGYFQ